MAASSPAATVRVTPLSTSTRSPSRAKLFVHVLRDDGLNHGVLVSPCGHVVAFVWACRALRTSTLLGARLSALLIPDRHDGIDRRRLS